jgi:beta-phosphoglucomutase-like phosphatase (HAD superfamily)
MKQPGMIFDSDGTLVDSVYQHVTAWREAFEKNGIECAQWRIHRATGMSGKLFLPKLLRDEGKHYSKSSIGRLEAAHTRRFSLLMKDIVPLPGAIKLLKQLKRRSIPFAIATSGDAQQTRTLLTRMAGIPECPVITADHVAAAKRAPNLFELAARKLEKEPRVLHRGRYRMGRIGGTAHERGGRRSSFRRFRRP